MGSLYFAGVRRRSIQTKKNPELGPRPTIGHYAPEHSRGFGIDGIDIRSNGNTWGFGSSVVIDFDHQEAEDLSTQPKTYTGWVQSE